MEGGGHGGQRSKGLSSLAGRLFFKGYPLGDRISPFCFKIPARFFRNRKVGFSAFLLFIYCYTASPLETSLHPRMKRNSMKIKNLFVQKKRVLSFELFPPKRDGNLEGLFQTVQELKQLGPDYISITYGAGGSSRDMTYDIAIKLKEAGG